MGKGLKLRCRQGPDKQVKQRHHLQDSLLLDSSRLLQKSGFTGRVRNLDLINFFFNWNMSVSFEKLLSDKTFEIQIPEQSPQSSDHLSESRDTS